MNLASLEQTFAEHRSAALAGSAGLVGVVALVAKHRARAAASTPDGATTTDGYTPAGYTNAGTAGTSGGYDSTASDIYNSLQPGIEDLQNRVGDLEQPKPVAPTPAPKPTPAKAKPKAPTWDLTHWPTGKKPAPKPAPKPKSKPAPKPTSGSYTIRSGDTLGKIAAKHHTSASRLYSLNAGTLDSAAKHHGTKSSNRGSLIYPGTVIHL